MSYNIEQANSGYMALTAGGLTYGSVSNLKLKTANTVTYVNNGILKSYTTAEVAFSSGHTSLAANQSCLFALWLTAGGTASTTQGPIVTAGDPCPVPAQATAGTTLIGLLKISSTVAFVPNTTALTGVTGVTYTFYDVALMPGSAQ
jgi:hypothetical protein